MNSEFSRDVWLGGLVGALRGVADVIGDYQQTHHNYSIASYEAGLDAGAENYLAQVALDFGLSEEKVLGRYWALRQEISPRAALAAVEDQLGLAPR